VVHPPRVLALEGVRRNLEQLLQRTQRGGPVARLWPRLLSASRGDCAAGYSAAARW
jgi:hypothetical protein